MAGAGLVGLRPNRIRDIFWDPSGYNRGMQDDWAVPWLLGHVKAALLSLVCCLLFGQPNQIEAHLQHQGSNPIQPRDVSIANLDDREEFDRLNSANFAFELEGPRYVTPASQPVDDVKRCCSSDHLHGALK